MIERSALRISNPPPKPLLIWDGDCHFCRHWVERWRDITGDAVDYETSQNAAAKFSEIPADQIRKSVTYINRNGEVFFGAEAVYRALQCRSSRNWLTWSYDHVPGFAVLSELSYRIVAQNRKIFS